MKRTHVVAAVAGTALAITAGALVLDATVDDTESIVGEARSSTDEDLLDEPVRVVVGDETVLEVRPGDRWTDVDVAGWVAEREAISDEEWWDFEKRLLREVIDDLGGE